MNIEKLADILRDSYNNAPKNKQVLSIHAFGMKYANEITQNNYSKAKIIELSGLPKSYQTELLKGINLGNYLNEKYVKTSDTKNVRLTTILYGPPGTGKTYNTVLKAMEIINPNCLEYDEKGKVSNYFDVKKEGKDTPPCKHFLLKISLLQIAAIIIEVVGILLAAFVLF